MATWGSTYTDSDGIKYRLGYTCTVTDNPDDYLKSDVTIQLELGWYFPSGYYVEDTVNKTRVYWGSSAVDPKADGANKSWSGWSTVASNSNISVAKGNSGKWVNKSIGTAKKTYSKKGTSQTFVLTATMSEVEEMSSYPAVSCSFTIPAEHKISVNLYSNYADYGTFQGEVLHRVTSAFNSQVHSQTFDEQGYYQDGLANIQNTGYLYLSKTGYYSTGYWGTSESGGILIDQNTSFTGAELATALEQNINTNPTVNLYAQWEKNIYTITFDANGGSVSEPVREVLYGDEPGPYPIPIRTGYTFLGWYTALEGGELDKDENTPMGTSNKILYAHWRVNTYTIKYSSNGGEGSMSDTNVVYGTTTYISNNTFIRTGYIFSGWHVYRHSDSKWLYTKLSDNTSVWLSVSSPPEGYVFRVYNNGSVSSTASSVDNDIITLYAQWSPITYIIEYKGNGATGGSMTNTNCTYDKSQNLKDNSYTRYGYVFTSWNTKADGTGQSFQNRQEVLNLTQNNGQSIQLFAQWEYVFVKINTTYEGKNVIGTLYARDENGNFQPVRELYQNQDNSFTRIN